jgi:hypothetical protein
MGAHVYGGVAILALGMIVAGFLIGGRFTVVGVATGGAAVILDRFTGSAKECFPGPSFSCHTLSE